MRKCDCCHILEVFSPLQYIPALFFFSHPMRDRSERGHWKCIDDHGCVRRSRRQEPDTSHIIILCEACGKDGVHTGIRDSWVEGDPFPEHRFVCSRCGEVCAKSEWKEIERAPL